jgi:hypothetical protein
VINKAPGVAQFFEITYNSYGDLFSGVVPFIAWFFTLGIIGLVLEVVDELRLKG